MPNPLVSLVVPVYKVERYLERCLDSIIAQDYRPIEVILVNDESPDGSGEIIKRYEAQWPFIQSIWQKNSGVGAARNAGIARATGQYLAMVDSDDYIEPDYVSSLVHAAEKENAEVAVCSFYFEFPHGFKIPFPMLTFQKNMSGEEAAQTSLKLLNMPTFSWNKLYRRDLFTEKGISFPSIYYEDLATVSRVLIQARNVAIVNKPYYHYCLRRSGITGNFGLKNVVDFLKAVAIIRQFIWSEHLWSAWEKPYRSFLRTVEVQLFIEINLQKNSIPLKGRSHLVRQVHHRIRVLGSPPESDGSDLTQTPIDLSKYKSKKRHP